LASVCRHRRVFAQPRFHFPREMGDNAKAMTFVEALRAHLPVTRLEDNEAAGACAGRALRSTENGAKPLGGHVSRQSAIKRDEREPSPCRDHRVDPRGAGEGAAIGTNKTLDSVRLMIRNRPRLPDRWPMRTRTPSVEAEVVAHTGPGAVACRSTCPNKTRPRRPACGRYETWPWPVKIF